MEVWWHDILTQSAILALATDACQLEVDKHLNSNQTKVWGGVYSDKRWRDDTQLFVYCGFGISKLHQTELLELVSSGKVHEAAVVLSTCINFIVLSFVNNKKVCAIFGCHVPPCIPSQHLWFSKFSVCRNIFIHPAQF